MKLLIVYPGTIEKTEIDIGEKYASFDVILNNGDIFHIHELNNVQGELYIATDYRIKIQPGASNAIYLTVEKR